MLQPSVLSLTTAQFIACWFCVTRADDPGAVLVLGEVGALAKLADERHPAEDRLVRCCVAAPPCVELVVVLVVLAHSGHSVAALVAVWGFTVLSQQS